MVDCPTASDSQDASDEQQSQPDSTAPSVASSDSSSTKTGMKKSRERSNSESSPASPNKLMKLTPRATRSSQNPDFAAKQRKFLNRVHDPIRRDNSDSENSQGSNTPVSSKAANKDTKNKSAERKSAIFNDIKRKSERDLTPKRPVENDEEGYAKKRRTKEPTKVVGGIDSYCWRCHRDGTVMSCHICPRVYHLKCVQMEAAPPKWMCPECCTLNQAEQTDTRSRAMRMLTLDQLCNLLRFALNRMKSYEGAEDFLKAVDVTEFPNYREYIVKPMDLTQLERNIKGKMYGSTEAFQADAKWMLHNSVIFNSVQSKFTNTARSLLKICRQEMQEIENCPDCYQNAHTRSTDSWFIEACRRPHILVWAKLKGFPFWPAKAMTTNSDNLVDVRFFGAHDRAWVPASSCFLFSKLSPAPTTGKNKRNLEDCLQELECHIKKLRDKFGQFEYPPYKTPYDPSNEDAQITLFLPKYEAKNVGKRMRLSLHHDGARKMLSLAKSSPAQPKQPATSPGSLPMTKPAQLEEKPTEQQTPTKSTPPVTTKKAYRTPLTAAAKKCFATEEQGCVKCKAKIAWSKDSTSKPVCNACSKVPDQKDKQCAKCQTRSCADWRVAQSGIVYCDSCFLTLKEPLSSTQDVQNKKDESASISNATIQKKLQASTETQDCPENEIVVIEEIVDTTAPGVCGPGQEGQVEGGNDGGEGGDEVQTPQTTCSGTDTGGELLSTDSPPKFIIPKANGKETADVSKKGSIVDRLKEKLCFVVEEAIKNHITTEDETEPIESSPEAEVPTVQNPVCEEVPKEPAPAAAVTDQTMVMQVLLHDLKNDKEMMDKLKESENSSKTNKVTGEIEVQTLTDSGSEPDSEGSNCPEQDSFVIEEPSSTKKKQNNINNVVNTIKERKSSVDEKVDSSSPKEKGSTTLSLDDSNDEVPILIIDEGDSNGSDSKRSSLKTDRNRRKGTPAKVFSRSSSSVESSDNSVTEEHSNKSGGSTEVLDEVSGQFRRPSSESNLTITLVTDEESPPKKAANDLRSVNISKSLSLSVVNDSSASLDMECAENDLDDQVIVDSVIKKTMPKPTARKTLPNSPKFGDLPQLKERGLKVRQGKAVNSDMVSMGSTVTVVDELTSKPPPLVTLHSTQPARASSSKGVRPPPLAATPTPSSSSAKSDLGPANLQLDQAVKKMSGHLRTLMEDLLRNMSESGTTEATIKSLQVEMEKLQWRHRQEVAELKHNTDLLVMEIRASLEAEKQRALLDAKHKHEVDKEAAVQETKRKQWCAFCQKEAQLYCCWNTAYCSYNCQQSHWMPHMNTCLNKQQGSSTEVSPRTAPPRPPSYVPLGQMHESFAMQMPMEEYEDAQDTLNLRPGHARRRCGECQGCLTQACGECYGCTNPKSHAVCKNRRCSLILSKPHQRSRQQLMMPPPPPPTPPPSYNPYRPNHVYASSNSTSPPPRYTNGIRPTSPFVVEPSFSRASL